MQSTPTHIPCVLSIAGSDSGGGAGIQADIKTVTVHGVYCTSVVTALTAQNTVGVQGVHIPPTEFIEAQLHSVLTDIKVDVVKTGMLPRGDIVRTVASAIRKHKISNVVVDPVLVSTSGDSLAGKETMKALVSDLFPLATLVTPNLSEAEKLTGKPIRGISDIRQACIDLIGLGCSGVLLKGGHLINEGCEDSSDPSVATDVFYDGKEFQAFTKPRIESKNTHGTGCTLASAIAAQLAKGHPLQYAIQAAKEYVFKGIVNGLPIGHGHGPLNHMHSLRILQRTLTHSLFLGLTTFDVCGFLLRLYLNPLDNDMPIPKVGTAMMDVETDFEEVTVSTRGRSSTVSMALPASIINNAQSSELRMYLAGQIARAAAIYNIDEIVIFHEEEVSENRSETRRKSRDSHSNPIDFLKLILEYMETPQYLRKHLFPMSNDLRLVGLLNPLALPSHVARDEFTRWREGVGIGRTKHTYRKPQDRGANAGSTGNQDMTRFVDVGQDRLVQIDASINSGERVTIDMELSGPGYEACHGKHLFGRLADRQEPRNTDGTYWGYSVRIARSLSEVFNNSQLAPKGYDLTIGTSERGTPIIDNSSAKACFALPEFLNLLVVFGGVHGLEQSVRGDRNLQKLGIIGTHLEESSNVLASHKVDDLFDFYVNTCPNQGSRTIRSEEAILISLAALRPYLRPKGGWGMS